MPSEPAEPPEPPAPSETTEAVEVKKKKLNVLGFQVQIAEHKIKKVLLGATSFFVIFNALTLPFAIPKLRRFLGAPYVPMKRRAVEALFEQVLPAWAATRNAGSASTAKGVSGASGSRLQGLQGLRLVDFGSGDGRIVAAAASKGMVATGYELNPYLVLWSRLRNWRRLRSAPGSGSLLWANAWSANLRDVDVVTVYGRPGDNFMELTAKKLDKELPPHAAVVSHFFDVPGWERYCEGVGVSASCSAAPAAESDRTC
ncbi:unnamed protein product [Durusdinium trenchii]|uniref:Uncharacterized protein n=1 Tax=Durusdinium trenchii TaxID=1381693 RepID=A0ABP0RYT0_9DINO